MILFWAILRIKVKRFNVWLQIGDKVIINDKEEKDHCVATPNDYTDDTSEP